MYMVKELEQVMVKRFRIRYTVRDSVSWYCLSMSTEDIDRNGLGVGITEECIRSVHCEGNCESNIGRILTSRIDQKGCI